MGVIFFPFFFFNGDRLLIQVVLIANDARRVIFNENTDIAEHGFWLG